MSVENKTLVARVLRSWSQMVRQRRLVVLLITCILTVGGLVYTARTLGVTTDTSSVVSDELRWRQIYSDFQEAFPSLQNELVVLVEANTPDLADDGARRLATALKADTSIFESVYQLDGGAFFDSYGLWYLNPDTLSALVERVNTASDLLSTLEQNLTLQGLATVLDSVARDTGAASYNSGEESGLAPVLGLLAASTFAATEGSFAPVPWSILFAGRPAVTSEQRRIISARPRMAFANKVPGREAMDRIRQVSRDLGLTERNGVSVQLTGKVAIETEELETAVKGVRQTGLLAGGSVALILFVALRSVRLILGCLAALVTGLVATSAFAAFAIGQLNLISVAFAVLYVGLGIDYALHLCMRYRAHLATGSTNATAVDNAVVEIGPSLALSALTTAACFLTFITTDFTGVSELGVIGAVGMVFSFFVTLTVLPAFMATFPSASPAVLVSEGLPRLAKKIDGSRKVVLFMATVTAAATLLLLPRVTFDDDPLNLRDPNSESMTAYRTLSSDSMAQPLTISVIAENALEASVAAKKLDALPEVRGTLRLADFVPREQLSKRRLLRELASQLPSPVPTIQSDVSGSDVVAQLAKSVNEIRWVGSDEERMIARQLYHVLRRWERHSEGWAPSDQSLHLAKLETALMGSLKDGLIRLRQSAEAEPVSEATLPNDLKRRWVTEDGRQRVEVTSAVPLTTTDETRRFVKAVRSADPGATGEAVSQVETGRVAVAAFQQALLAAGLITMVLLVLLLRSAKDAAIVVGPLVLAAVWTGALVVLFDLQFNFANVIALPLLLGVGVDNGIHMMHHARSRPSSPNPLKSSTSRAVLFASLTTIASFGNLAFSVHVGMASMGRLLTLGMICVLIATLVVMPALLATRRLDLVEEVARTGR